MKLVHTTSSDNSFTHTHTHTHIYIYIYIYIHTRHSNSTYKKDRLFTYGFRVKQEVMAL